MSSKLRSGSSYKPISIIFYDLETTGFNPYHDSIIEIGAIKYFNGKIYEFSSLVSINRHLSKKISEITNISDDDLINKPKIDSVLKDFNDFIFNDSDTVYMIAHNNDSFDKLFLEINFEKINLNFNKPIYIDSLRLCQKLIPDRFSYSLKSLCKDFDIIQENAHRALDDSYSLFYIYKKLCAILSMNIDYSYKIILNKPDIIYNYISKYNHNLQF